MLLNTEQLKPVQHVIAVLSKYISSSVQLIKLVSISLAEKNTVWLKAHGDILFNFLSDDNVRVCRFYSGVAD